MSNITPNLELFKYDLSTDGKEPFSITDSLNNNWDKIDNAFGSISVPIATYETVGIVKPDGESIFIDENGK